MNKFHATHHAITEGGKIGLSDYPVNGKWMMESRICFGIVWFEIESEADRYSNYVREKGITYNGGFFHGMPCGRDSTFDFTDNENRKWYAVTD